MNINKLTESKSVFLPNVSRWASYGGNVLWTPVFTLTGLGILFVYSASSVYSTTNFGSEFYFAKKQALFLIPALLSGLFGIIFPLRLFFKYIRVFFCSSLVLTFLTHVPFFSRKVGGASRWLNLGPISIQPSEFLKIFTLLYLVTLLCPSYQKPLNQLTHLNEDKRKIFSLDTFLLLCAPLAIILQKDLGTTVVVLGGCMAILFMNGLQKRFFISLFCMIGFGFLVAILVEPYRIVRIMTFLNPFKDPLGSGFQIIQSFVAVANGGLLGRGIGESQQKLFFLPEAHTDFILAVFTEEMGFLGVLLLSILYVILFYAFIRIVLCAYSQADRLVASGFFALLALTTIINMGVVAGALPTKGLPLPFISNGGSALISNYLIIGILSQISRKIYKTPKVES